MNWLEIAKELQLEQKAYIDCECGGGKTLVVNHRFKGYSCFCFRCDRQEWEAKGQLSIADIAKMQALNEEAKKYTAHIELPPDYTTDIPIEGRLWLYRASISASLIKKYNIGYSEKLKRVILPVYRYNKLIWFLARAVHPLQQPKYIAPSENRDSVLFYANYTPTKLVVITEDILSAIRVGEVCSCVSLLGTKITIEQINTLSKHKVVLWLDSDLAGQRATNKIERELGMVTDVVRITTPLDPKFLTKEQIHNEIKRFI